MAQIDKNALDQELFENEFFRLRSNEIIKQAHFSEDEWTNWGNILQNLKLNDLIENNLCINKETFQGKFLINISVDSFSKITEVTKKALSKIKNANSDKITTATDFIRTVKKGSKKFRKVLENDFSKNKCTKSETGKNSLQKHQR